MASDNTTLLADLSRIEDASLAISEVEGTWFKDYVKTVHDLTNGVEREAGLAKFREWSSSLETDYRVLKNKFTVTIPGQPPSCEVSKTGSPDTPLRVEMANGSIYVFSPDQRQLAHGFTGESKIEREPMPGPYRSAKSVVTKAIKAGVTMVTVEGDILGKTAIQNASRESKEKAADPRGYFGTKLRSLVREGMDAGLSRADWLELADNRMLDEVYGT